MSTTAQSSSQSMTELSFLTALSDRALEPDRKRRQLSSSSLSTTELPILITLIDRGVEFSHSHPAEFLILVSHSVTPFSIIVTLSARRPELRLSRKPNSLASSLPVTRIAMFITPLSELSILPQCQNSRSSSF